MARQGWHGENEAHGLCAKGIKVRKPKMKAGGKKSPMDEVLHELCCVECRYPTVKLKYSGFLDMLVEDGVVVSGDEPFCPIHGLNVGVKCRKNRIKRERVFDEFKDNYFDD